ncbi:MBOAT family O-acyltransferase [Croceitalea rosinachiae]|uniref:MBOAT family O-acyltransferase n=1 Tax=Croceitalea rosinachiae TaxID=3075596 RepID=UPI003D77E582
MTLAEYIRKRNGVPIGSSKSLRNNLYRSLGAKNFSTFWNYWNPVFGYYLGKYIFKPLKKRIPVAFALLFTFIFCGLIHDVITIIYRKKTSLFFTIWFAIMGITVLMTKYLKHDFNKQKWSFRALVNLSIISLCFLMTFYITKILI